MESEYEEGIEHRAWSMGYRKTEVRRQRPSANRRQRAERRSDVRGRRSEIRRQMTEDEGQRAAKLDQLEVEARRPCGP